MPWIPLLNSIAHIRYLYLIFCLHALASASSDLPVCVVGAGPSGLSAAHALESIGRSTVIFEQQRAVGGRAQNYRENELAFYLGPLLVSNGSHPETMKIVDAVNVPLRDDSSTTNWLFNWTTGETWPAQSPTSPTLSSQFADEVARYTLQWQSEYEPFASSLYPNGVPDDLTVSTSEWFGKGGYPILEARFIQLLTAWGYGNANDVPALYTLSIFTPASLATSPSTVDLHEVFERYSRQLTRSEIYLGTEIESIDRSGDSVNVHYSSDSKAQHPHGNPSLQRCSDVIIAFPPTINSLQYAGLELSPAESTVFSAVETSNYFAIAVRLDIPRMSSFNVASVSPNISADIAGEPVFVQNMYNNSDVAVTYSLALHSQSTDQVTDISLQSLSRINRDPREAGFNPTPVRESDITALRHYPAHYPHFNATALQEGWYERFSNIQGGNRTYYTSGLNQVEHVEYAIRAARDLVEEHFAS